MANKNVQIAAEFKMETQDTQNGITTSWFQVQIPGYELAKIFVGLSKKSGEWLSASNNFFSLDTDIRNLALSESRMLLHKMS